MCVICCFIDLVLYSGQIVILLEEMVNYLVWVMCLCEGDICVLFNGDGYDYSVMLIVVGKCEVQVCIDVMQVIDNELLLVIILLQGIVCGEKMDLILQKVIELGVVVIILVNVECIEVKFDLVWVEKCVVYWNNVVILVCGQFGCVCILLVGFLLLLVQVVVVLLVDLLWLILDLQGVYCLLMLGVVFVGGIVIVIGLEGGWLLCDCDQLVVVGFQGLQLGSWILCMEMVGLVVVVVLQVWLGDLG